MAALSDLSVEILALIFDKLFELDAIRASASLKNASLTCWSWYYLTAPRLFRRVIIQVPPAATKCEGTAQEEYLEFLSSNTRAPSYVQEVCISISCDSVPVRWAHWLEKLLHRLPRLMRISVSEKDGQDRFELVRPRVCASLSLDDFKTALVRVLRGLGRDTEVSLQLPGDTDSIRDLGSASTVEQQSTWGSAGPAPRLTALRVTIPYEADERYVFPSSDEAKGKGVSGGVNDLLRRHENLQHLCLELRGRLRYAGHNDHLNVECQIALENIVLEQPGLKSLALHGPFHFSDQAWVHWSSVRWAQLESLSLEHPCVVGELARRLAETPLPSLRTLKVLRAWWHRSTGMCGNDGGGGGGGDEQLDGTNMSPPPPPALLELLGSLRLEQLSLTGYAPALLERYLKWSGGAAAAQLRRLRFHHTQPWHKEGEDRNQLSPAQIRQLGSACPRLAWLDVGVARHQLLLDQLPLLDQTVHCDAAGGGVGSSGGSNSGSSPPRMPYLDALASVPALRHLRIHVHGDFNGKSDALQAPQIVNLFRNVQARKAGLPLESVAIICGLGRPLEVCIVSAWGERCVVVESRPHRGPRKVERWDTRNMVVLEDYATRWTNWDTWEFDERDDIYFGTRQTPPTNTGEVLVI